MLRRTWSYTFPGRSGSSYKPTSTRVSCEIMPFFLGRISPTFWMWLMWPTCTAGCANMYLQLCITCVYVDYMQNCATMCNIYKYIITYMCLAYTWIPIISNHGMNMVWIIWAAQDICGTPPFVSRRSHSSWWSWCSRPRADLTTAWAKKRQWLTVAISCCGSSCIVFLWHYRREGNPG